MATKNKTEPTGYSVRLIRGRIYFYGNKAYHRGVTTPVSKDVAKALYNEVITSVDSRSGDRIEKHRFKVIGLDDDDISEIEAENEEVENEEEEDDSESGDLGLEDLEDTPRRSMRAKPVARKKPSKPSRRTR